MNRADALSRATQILVEAGVETPELDAKRLLLATENIDAAQVLASPEAAMQAQQAFDSAISRRAAREPVSKILGYRDFWTHRFKVSPDVLDPRPDTETLIEAALEIAPRDRPLRIADLGTGSGCIVLSLLSELPNASGVGADISQAALAVARENASTLGLSERAAFIVSNWFSGLDGTFNLVVSNPPYISTTEKDVLAPEVVNWDPEAALFAGMDGLQAYREIADGLDTVLDPDGAAIFELGFAQLAPVTTIFEKVGFRRISSHRDLGGIERCIVVQR